MSNIVDLLRHMGRFPLAEYEIVVETATVVAVATTGSEVLSTTPANADGYIIDVKGTAWDPAAASFESQKNAKTYMRANVKVGNEPITRGLYIPLELLVGSGSTPRPVGWAIKQGEKISATFQNAASAGMPSLHGNITFGVVSTDTLNKWMSGR